MRKTDECSLMFWREHLRFGRFRLNTSYLHMKWKNEEFGVSRHAQLTSAGEDQTIGWTYSAHRMCVLQTSDFSVISICLLKKMDLLKPSPFELFASWKAKALASEEVFYCVEKQRQQDLIFTKSYASLSLWKPPLCHGIFTENSIPMRNK